MRKINHKRNITIALIVTVFLTVLELIMIGFPDCGIITGSIPYLIGALIGAYGADYIFNRK